MSISSFSVEIFFHLQASSKKEIFMLKYFYASLERKYSLKHYYLTMKNKMHYTHFQI